MESGLKWWIGGGVIVGIIFSISFFLSVDMPREPRRNLKRCLDNVRLLEAALAQYAADNGGFLPPANGAEGLEYLRRSRLVTDGAVFICPGGKHTPVQSGPLTEEYCSYAFYGRNKLPGEADELLLLDKPGNHPERAFNAVYADRRIESKRDAL